jgi:YVTN family beta-propeller protein
MQVTLMTPKLHVLALALTTLLSTPPGRAADILALDKDGGRLHVIDRDTFALRHSVPIGSGAHEVIASRDGRRGFVALYGDAEEVGHTLVEVDLAAGSVVRRIDTFPLLRPHGLAQAGENFYFTAELSRALARFNPEEGRVDRVYGIGGDVPHMVEIAADRQQLFTADMLSGTVSRLDFRAGQPYPVLTTYPVGDKPEGLAVHPDGRQVWVGLNGEGKVQVLDLESGTVVASLPAGSYPARVEFSRDGTLAFVIDPNKSQLRVFDVATRTQVHAHTIAGVPLGMLPGIAADRLFLTLAEAGAVVEIDVSTGAVLRRVELGRVADGIALAEAAE